MFGNGVVIGMETTPVVRRQILRDHHPALTACPVVAVGVAMRGIVECRIATTIVPVSRTTTLDCGLPYRIDREVQKSRLAWVRVSGLPMSMRLRSLQQNPLMPILATWDISVLPACDSSILPIWDSLILLACDR